MYLHLLYKKYRDSLLIFALVSWIIFLFIELMARIYDLYRIFPPIDIPTHFFAGVAITSTFFWAFSHIKLNQKRIALMFLLTFIVSMAWEATEMVGELIIQDPPHLKDYFFWDGFFDVITNLIGCAFSYIILFKIRRRYFKEGVEI